MEHRHLLPDEIDQLLDGEAGFGVAPLQAHVDVCPACRAELADARQVVAALERLPHFNPSSRFADRVMAQVQVFEPWHVSALDTVKRWIPASRPARVFAASTAFVFALVASATALWAAVRLDAFVFLADLAGQRARRALFDAAGEAIASAFGGTAVDALRAGGVTAAIGITGFLAVVILAALGLRTLVATARRRRT